MGNTFEPLAFALLLPMALLWTFAFIGHRRHWRGRDYALVASSASLAAMRVFTPPAVTSSS